jgi:hypothetical protein
MRFQYCGTRSHGYSEKMADATGARSESVFAVVVDQKSHPCFDILPPSSRIDIPRPIDLIETYSFNVKSESAAPSNKPLPGRGLPFLKCMRPKIRPCAQGSGLPTATVWASRQLWPWTPEGSTYPSAPGKPEPLSVATFDLPGNVCRFDRAAIESPLD